MLDSRIGVAAPQRERSCGTVQSVQIVQILAMTVLNAVCGDSLSEKSHQKPQGKPKTLISFACRHGIQMKVKDRGLEHS